MKVSLASVLDPVSKATVVTIDSTAKPPIQSRLPLLVLVS